MSRIEFKNLPDQTTPITAENLNKLNNLAIDTSVGEHEEEVVLLDSRNLFNPFQFKNVGYKETVSGITYEVMANGGLKLTGTSTAVSYFYYVGSYSASSSIIGKLKAGNYYATLENGDNCKFYYLNGTNTIFNCPKNGIAVNLTSDTNVTGIMIRVEKEKTLNTTIYPMLNKGNTALSYEPPIIKEIYANKEKYTDTLNIGVEPNNSGLWVEHSKNIATNVTYISTTTKYGGMCKATYSLVKGKTYTISFKTDNSGLSIYRQSPESLGFESLSLYSWTCNGNRVSMKGVAKESATYNNVTIISRNSDTSSVSCSVSDLQIEEGENATSYEPYITPSIKVNNNGVYETIVSQPVVLWTNSSPTSAFANQNVTLSTSDYNYYEVLFVEQLNSFNGIISTGKVPKGKGTSLNTITNYASSTPQVFRRAINYTNDTTLAVEVGYYQVLTSSSRSSNNQIVVPYQILGYK